MLFTVNIYCNVVTVNTLSLSLSSQTGISPEWEGRDEEPGWTSSLVCDWTMNSWVFRQYYGGPSLRTRTYMWPGRDPHAGPRAPSGRSRAMPGPARTHSQPPGGSNNPQVRLPGGARCCKGPIAAAGRVTRARISPCRVLHSIDWEGEQALFSRTHAR